MGDIPLGQAEMLTNIDFSIGLLPRLAAGFLLAPMRFAWLAMRFCWMEAGKNRFVGSLVVFAIASGILVGWSHPLNQPFALLAG